MQMAKGSDQTTGVTEGRATGGCAGNASKPLEANAALAGGSYGSGILLLLSGPAGSGKTTLCDRLLQHCSQIQRVVTATSRAPRAGEQDGIDYFFFELEAFRQRITEGAFYEWAQVHGRYYGTLRSQIDDKLAQGQDLLINVDVQGAETFRTVAAEPACPLHGRLVTVFVSPSNLDELRNRLRGRGTDDEAEIERRMQTAIGEMEHTERYDHVIDSRDRETDFAALLAIYEAERNHRRRS